MINLLFLACMALLSCDSQDLPEGGLDPISPPELSNPDIPAAKTDFY